MRSRRKRTFGLRPKICQQLYIHLTTESLRYVQSAESMIYTPVGTRAYRL